MLKDKKRIAELVKLGATCFMMMIDPVGVPFKTRDEADCFMAGYRQRQREWNAIESNRMTPPIFQTDEPRRHRAN